MLEFLIQNYDVSDIIHQAIIVVLLVMLLLQGNVRIKWRAGH